MSKLLHLKASTNKILNSLPNRDFGSDGDIVISRISGRGVYLCSKAGGIWYTGNKMSELARIDKNPLDITAKKIKIKNIKNTLSDTDRFIVSNDDGELRYRNSEQLLSDLDTDALSINYKTAYCSLGQYDNKEDCESNKGTWYYSENDSHDSLNNVAENELLTVGSSIGKLDAESTLIYDGSTLEIKRNADFDDNWQTSAQDALLKLSYDSSNNAIFSIDSSGNLTQDVSGDILMDAAGGDVTITSADVSIAATQKLYFDGGGNTYIYESSADALDFYVGGQQMLQLRNFGIGVDNVSVYNGHLAIPEGNILYLDGISGGEYLKSVNNDVLIYAGGNAQIEFSSEGTVLFQNDYSFDVSADNTLDVQDSGGSVLKIQTASISIPATNKLYFDAGNDTYITETSSDVLDIYVGDQNMMKFSESTLDSIQTYVDTFSIEAGAKLYFDGGGDTYITEASADVVRQVVGGDIFLELRENGADGNEVYFKTSSAGFTQLEPTYNASATPVDFRHSNKQNLTFGAGNIVHMQLYFPSMSGNFQLLMKQDGTGSRSVTGAWKVYEYDESVASGGSGVVVWAGGSAPTLTTDANHVDILSFYWDNVNQICYGVASLDFQF